MQNVKKKNCNLQFKQNKLKNISLFCFLISSLGFLLFPVEVSAQNSRANNSSPPQGQGTPRGTPAAGSRSCQTAEKPMVVLTKTEHDSPQTILRWGYTTEAHPTFYVYVPYQLEKIQSAKLSLRTDGGKQVYSTYIDITDSPGIIEVKLPEAAPELALNIWYQVHLSVRVLCSPTTAPTPNSITASVQRKEADSVPSDLSSNTQSSLLLETGFWYDQIAALIKQLSPESKEQWVALLKEAGLEQYVNEPIIQCCTHHEAQ